MTDCLGLTLDAALRRLRARGIEPCVIMTSNPRREGRGTARVVRVSPDGQTLTCALFPDKAEEEN